MPVEVDVVVWNGVQWRRYPNAKQRNRRRYYQGYLNGVLCSLHRAKWEDANGPIPDSHEIHHRDGDPLNNELDNLELLTVAEHRKREGELGSFNTDAVHANLDRIRSLAAAWHATEEGKKWHSDNGKQAMVKRAMLDLVCSHCGAAFKSKQSFAKLCSSKCREAARPPRNLVHTRTCEECKKEFSADRKTARFCSYSCSGKARWAARRARLQPPS
jgi:hypothetical protein